MNTLHWIVNIKAPKLKVWKTMLEPETYRQWAEAFAEGSYFEGSWDKGATIRFLDPMRNGMVSVIAENRPYAFISIKHLGYVKNGVDDTESDEIKAWLPAFENYTFSDTGDMTELAIALDVPEDMRGYMEKAWPKALAKLKQICEAP